MFRLISILVIAVLSVLPAAAEPSPPALVVGVRSAFVIDPHMLFLGPNMAAARHVYDSLVGRDADARWVPALAESWTMRDERTWEFTLRRGVRFHDGEAFTASDVTASFARVPSLPGNPGPYTPNLRGIVSSEIVDDHTLRIVTDQPNPVLPGQLTNIFVVSARHAQDSAADYAAGRAAIGTGPYRLEHFTYNEGMSLIRNDGYWGTPPAFAHVTLRVIGNNAAREAALLSGDIGLMEEVPTADVARLRATPGIAVFARPSDRLIYLIPNSGAEHLSLLTSRDGHPLESNPLRDPRVRRALSLAIDRRALVERVMAGQASPTGQLVPDGFGGYDPAVPVPAPDSAGARRLLAEAGFPDGLGLTLGCTGDRYVNDSQVCQALGQMLARAGIAAKVEVMPGSVFFPRARAGRNDLPLILFGTSMSSTRDATHMLVLNDHTTDPVRNLGEGNRGGFSDPVLDAMIDAAATRTDAGRIDALREAAAEAVARGATIPLYVEYTIAAARDGITYTPRVDEQMVATGAAPAPAH
jgi:peptide/nickel transport system substrate-binding protein